MIDQNGKVLEPNRELAETLDDIMKRVIDTPEEFENIKPGPVSWPVLQRIIASLKCSDNSTHGPTVCIDSADGTP